MEYQILVQPSEKQAVNGKCPCVGYIDGFNMLQQWFEWKRREGVNSVCPVIDRGELTTVHGQYVLSGNYCVQSTIGYKGRVETLLANVENVWMLELWFDEHHADRLYRYFFTVRDGNVYPEFSKDGIVACNLTFHIDIDVEHGIEEVKKTATDTLVINNL